MTARGGRAADGDSERRGGAAQNKSVAPFWPRRSPHFLRVRTALRDALNRQGITGENTSAAVILAVSGGPDSLALAAAAAAEKLPAHVVSVDHQLQAGSREVSDNAIAQVRRWGLSGEVVAVDLGVAAGAATTSEPEYSEPNHSATGNLEAAARHARYRALCEVAGQRPILVAHTGDDQAETLLLGLLRGKAAAMAENSDYQGHTIVRPLLNIRRADTVGACRELGVDAWDDPHNSQDAFRRVAIRQHVLPLLDEIVGGDATAPLQQAANLLRDDDTYLQTLAHTALTESVAAENSHREREHHREQHRDQRQHRDQHQQPRHQKPPRLTIATLGPAPVARRAIAAFLHQHGARVNASVLAAIMALIDDWHGQGAVSVGNGLELARQAGTLVLLHSEIDGAT
ncbi:tRNA lysidine(34) synthetase TilS [Corynebacterium sp. MNWGS58]|uniref:tRNA lysidine(34) synthetase TilS n=1 Tax=Corynebacterium sp. 102791.4 TaxID=3104612 RepID=UPI00351455DD